MTKPLGSRAWFTLAGLVWIAPALVSQEAHPPQSTTIQSKTEEVLLDVIVRDKKGHPVTDLRAEDFQVLDNGTPKKISSFRLVQGREAVAGGGTRTQLDPLQQVRLITMIFQCWSNDARKLSRDAALDLIKGELPQNVYVSVMAIDHKLEVLQPYTNDLALLRKAIDRVTRSEVKDYSADSAVVETQLQEMLGPNTSGALTQQAQVASAQDTLAAQGRSASGADFAAAAMAQIILSMLQTQQASAAAEGGRINIYALLDAVREQYRLPGRKTVLYFSEGGFVIPQGMEQPFKNVISVANRANVSFYSIDARGLSTFYSADDRGQATYGANSSAMASLNTAAQNSQRQFNDTGQPVSAHEEGERVKALDKALDSTRGNTQNTLANLAESTGGSLIANTNDLRGPLHRVEEDIQTYYEISYSPEIKNYDGSFHTISVKTTATDLHVQSRSGYFALPPGVHGTTAFVSPFEVPLLNAINSTQPPQDFAFHAAIMHFRDLKQQPISVLAIDVPFANVTFVPKEKEPNQFDARLSYLALIKDSKGTVLNKIENELPISISSDKLAALKNSHFLYKTPLNLAPGDYLVDVAVLDSASQNKISAQKSKLTVAPPATTLAVSSVSFVRRMDVKSKDASQDFDPLQFGDKVIYPDLDPAVKQGTGINLSFYLVAYADPKIPAAPVLTMEFSQNGHLLGKASTEIGKPDGTGKLQYVGSIPASQLSPGEYSVRFALQQGTEGADETASFRVQ
jgi:VWFA-related protein